MKVLIASVLPEGKRNLAFGLLYEQSRYALVAFAMAAQLLAIPVFATAGRRTPAHH